MDSVAGIPVQDWALPGEPFRLVAVEIGATNWAERLPAAARARLERFMDPAARARAGAADWFKFCWLPGELGLVRVEWETGPHGKPRPGGAAAAWGFNLSHTGNYVVAALVRGLSIGVDLESTARRADVAGLAERVFSATEREQVRIGGRPAFFALWSRKEALLKALGCGWADGEVVRRTRLEIVAFQVEPATGVRIWARPGPGGAYELAVALTAPGA